MNMEQIEQQMRKTHIVLKRNTVAEDKAKNLAAFAKNLAPDALAIMVINLIVLLSSSIYRKNIESLLKESFDADLMDQLKPILDDLDNPRLTLNKLISEAQIDRR